ncbi:MAG: hypothetical protein HXX08_14255 [Chloroflexi bacterium]|uniref:PqqD family protein n=1 Tax=Candidatus Chlorohelix allophototropha TaxID=3003348 RepID=A0A8T7M4J8_9CHLR|nr:hypothetical protein [Chloroflexota bacterium]WJW70333.1 hypothetical protein OZ401_005067 [Chloroflexota bacterium L227-S17]
MKNAVGELILISPKTIQWVQDSEEVLVVNEQCNESHSLRGVEAAVWNCLVLGYSYADLLELLANLLDLPKSEAATNLNGWLEKWQRVSLLQKQEGFDD